jgi:hypothetical protein
MTTRSLRITVVLTAVCMSATGWAQSAEVQDPDHLRTTHSVLQKTGLGTIAVTGALGVALAMNRPTLFGEGRCNTGNPIFGQYGCVYLPIVHFFVAASTLLLFTATEIVAQEMPSNPYEFEEDLDKRDAMRTLRWVNVGFFAATPVLGLLAAHPGLIGIPEHIRPQFSRILRTIHLGLGIGTATTYSINAGLQW